MKDSAPNVFTIVLKDFYSSYVLIFLLITLLIYGVLRFFPLPVEFSSEYLLILVIIEIIILSWRGMVIKRLISEGLSVEGTIERVYKTGGSGSGIFLVVEYSYTYNDQQFKNTYPKGKGFEQGQKVTVKIDPNNYQKSIIENIFY